MKYIDAIEKIRKEIDKWTEAMADAVGEYSDGVRFALNHFAFVLDTIEEEPSEDLEKAATEYAKLRETPELQSSRYFSFIAGANWQKAQMIRDVVEGKIYGYYDGSFELIASWLDLPKESIFKDGDKVKIIIVKEDD